MSSNENQSAATPVVTPTDEVQPALSRDASDSTLDPTHRVGHLKLAKKKPVCVRPTATIPEAITLMMMHDFSQLPVMIGERAVKGIFSWKSLGQKLALKQKCNYVKEAMEEAVIINVNRSLFDAARLVAESDCILIRDDQEVISGILTSYDLSVNFAERSEPFLLLEQIEKHVRSYVENRLSLSEMQEVHRSPAPEHSITDASKLSFGDYVRILQRPDRWKKVGLSLDQTLFVKELDEVRMIRNKIMHFDPNGLAHDDMQKLRKFAGLLRQVQQLLK